MTKRSEQRKARLPDSRRRALREDRRLAPPQLGDNCADRALFVVSHFAGNERLQQRELGLARCAAADMRRDVGALDRRQRAVGVTAENIECRTIGTRAKRLRQDFRFHFLMAALNLRRALTMYAFAPLALVRPSCAVIASSRISCP